MKNLTVVVYTMNECPFCTEFKKMLSEKQIEFVDRDIDKFSDEFDLYSDITKSDRVPALMLIEGDEEDFESFLYAPEKNFYLLNEALDLVESHRKKLGLI